MEIPQLGVVRSLNVHVSGAIAVWEFTKQQRLRGAEQAWAAQQEALAQAAAPDGAEEYDFAGAGLVSLRRRLPGLPKP